MKSLARTFRWGVPLVLGAAGLLGTRPAAAQGKINYPAWERESGVAINNPTANSPLTNKYLALWEYYTGAHTTRFNIWTNAGDPQNPLDDYSVWLHYWTATNGDITFDAPWGSLLFSSQFPEPLGFDSNGHGTGMTRPIANVLTLHVQDPTNTANNGFTDFLYPEDGAAEFGPPRVPLTNDQGYFAPYRFTAQTGGTGGTGTTGQPINLEVTQKTEFARDLMRIEVTIKNTGTTTRNVGARMLLNPYVDLWGNTRSVYLPDTQQRVTFESDFTGATMPSQWQMFDDDSGQNPVFVAKGILTDPPGQPGRYGATTPSRLVVGNMLDILPWALAKTAYDWTVRPDFELRIADIGFLMYWTPVTIPAGQTRSFVTYAGMGVADHGMSDAYKPTHLGKPDNTSAGVQGFIGAVQTPFALPLTNGAADIDGAGNPAIFNVDAFYQNEFLNSVPSATAFLTLPDGLAFPTSSTTQSLQIPFSRISSVGNSGDEQTGQWKLVPTGIEAGLLPITVTFSNSLRDSARVTRMINVPQGTLYQLTDDWKMITFPFTFNGLQNDPATALGLQPGTFQIVRYNPESTAANPYELVTQIEPGQSYWVRMLGLGTQFVRLQNATPVRLGTTDPSGTDSLLQTDMLRGWNQMGDPSPYPVSVRDLRFITPQVGPQLFTYDQAVSMGWIRPTLYVYNRKTGVYDPLNRNSIVQPGQGVWVFSTDDRQIVWPSPLGPKLSIN